MNYKHGMTHTPEYSSWMGMRQRCYYQGHKAYSYYGGAGITVCERWRDFTVFYEDMGPRPEGTSLDRINPYGNYEPGNCRWATKEQQAQNRRGESMASMARKCGLVPRTVSWRLNHGWSIERALMTRTPPLDDPMSLTNVARREGITKQALFARRKRAAVRAAKNAQASKSLLQETPCPQS